MKPAPESTMPTSYVVRVLLFREGDHWVAQGLEFDLAAQGRTPEETKHAFERTFVGRLIFNLQHGRQPLEGVTRAPQEFWDTFSNITRGQQQLERPERIPAPNQVHGQPELPPAFMIPVIQQSAHQHS